MTSLCFYGSALFVSDFFDDALRHTVPSVNEPLLQVVSVAFLFSCNAR